MKFLLKIIVGFSIGRLMSLIYQLGYLSMLPSIIIAIFLTIAASILIEAGFIEDMEK